MYVEGSQDNNNQLEVWQLSSPPDPLEGDTPDDGPPPPTLVLELWAPAHNCGDMQLSSNGLLAVPGTAGDVHVSIY